MAGGRFTQEDPIGLAGGLNLYGFAGGDPVNFSDPFGLKVEFYNDGARKLWEDLRREATEASRSKNKDMAKAGRRLLNAMTSLERDDDLLTVSVETGRGSGFGPRTDAPGYGILVDPNRPSNVEPYVVLSHELGHAYQSMVSGPNRIGSYPRAVGFENSARTIAGCGHTSALYNWTYQRGCR